ncbi:MAG: chemotaxis protein CheA [Acidaminobacter sp.]|nr:chemotaxis protein CheA [Acidaminobacter sp.]MZQ99749.1 chemotaxis protein CheA [Acidaminobacter sp.]
MPVTYENESMLEIYIFEASQSLDQMEQIIMKSEREGTFGEEAVNEIFRFMHTIKGSSAMMMFHNITTIAHTMEDIFFFLREKRPQILDYSTLSDLVLDGVDFMKVEVNKIKNHDAPDGNPEDLVMRLKAYLDEILTTVNTGEDKAAEPETVSEKDSVCESEGLEVQPSAAVLDSGGEGAPEPPLKPRKDSKKKKSVQSYKAKLYFQDGCEMEHLRAYGVVHDLTELAEEMFYCPQNILEEDGTAETIRNQGFELFIRTTATMEELQARIEKTVFLEQLILGHADQPEFEPHCMHQDDIHWIPAVTEKEARENAASGNSVSDTQLPLNGNSVSDTQLQSAVKEQPAGSQSMISVNVEKLDGLMNLVGELVIAEAMVTQNPEVLALESDQFQKASRQLHKITTDLQDMVMSIRMVPLSTTFIKMHRIVRDMSKKLNKQVVLDMAGEETEVDKNIIERISDPLMHLIRNAIDHGIEDEAERLEKGKDKIGRISLEAKNAGSDVLIILRDDGRGLSKEKILAKARANGLLTKPEHEMSDREIYNLILLPGFSTKEQVTEFSGRGVGMDVVAKNLEEVGGAVHIESAYGQGTTMTLKIPLTLAIIEGMNIRVGSSRFTIPITSIKESFKPAAKDCHKDPDHNEMVMVRGKSYPILRMHQHFHIEKTETVLADGILIMVEDEDKEICLFADELLGQQQVVVKALPHYIKSMKKILGLAGCTLLGDGSISLILDVSGLAGLRVR